MNFKDPKNLTNAEMSQYKLELENKYQALQNQINKLCDELDTIDKEYVKVSNEMRIRQINIYK